MTRYEELQKQFDDAKAELEAFQKEEAEKVEAEKKAELVKKQNEISNEKKALCQAIDAAENALSDAERELELAREKVKQIYEEAHKQAEEILNPAKNAVADAQMERYKSIAEFNKKFGAYKKIYTGDSAYKEMQKAVSYFDDIFGHLWF